MSDETKDLPIVEEETRCTCAECEWDWHPCPFQQDVEGNDEDFCSCCPFCEAACADDI